MIEAFLSGNTSASTVVAPPVVVEAHRGGGDAVDRIDAEWGTLCDTGPSDQPFYRPEWIRAYHNAFAPEAPLLLITTRLEGRLTSVLPLLQDRVSYCGFGLRRLRASANWHTCRFDFVHAEIPGARATAEPTWRFLAGMRDWDLLEFGDIPENGALELLEEFARRDGFFSVRRESIRSPYYLIPPPGAGEEWWLPPLSSKHRKKLRRAARDAATAGPLVFRRVDLADSEQLQRFYELEGSGWKGREGTAILSSAETRRFYSEIAHESTRRGYFSLYLLECGGRLVAGQLGLTYRGRYFMPKVAYDETREQYAPGHLIIQSIIRDAALRGVSEIDFLGDNDEWKLRWAGGVRPHSRIYIFRNNLRSRILGTLRFRAVPRLYSMAAGLRAQSAAAVARFRPEAR